MINLGEIRITGRVIRNAKEWKRRNEMQV